MLQLEFHSLLEQDWIALQHLLLEWLPVHSCCVCRLQHLARASLTLDSGRARAACQWPVECLAALESRPVVQRLSALRRRETAPRACCGPAPCPVAALDWLARSVPLLA